MTVLSPNIRTLRALGRELSAEAEARFPREGRIAPERHANYEDHSVALLLGSLAQVATAAADALEAEEAEQVAAMEAKR